MASIPLESLSLNDGPAENKGSPAASKRHPFFWLEPLFVRVENVDFQLPRVAFEGRVGSAFADASSLPSQQGPFAEGRTADKPVVLDNVSIQDFENLLHVLFANPNFPIVPGKGTSISTEMWKSVFRLAAMWSLTDLRTKAINALDLQLTALAERTAIARECGVREWLISGYERLILGNIENLESEHCSRLLGAHRVLQLTLARIEYGVLPTNLTPFFTALKNGETGATYACIFCRERHLAGRKDGLREGCIIEWERINFSVDENALTSWEASAIVDPKLKEIIERRFADGLKGAEISSEF
ncbi:hypothetical protein BJ165DRAFT_290034 [Panaeolus papilionaceus]|nr:hypothetical protein BJ165DRAFT_290034 [Panaeolus papilionaceus]